MSNQSGDDDPCPGLRTQKANLIARIRHIEHELQTATGEEREHLVEELQDAYDALAEVENQLEVNGCNPPPANTEGPFLSWRQANKYGILVDSQNQIYHAGRIDAVLAPPHSYWGNDTILVGDSSGVWRLSKLGYPRAVPLSDNWDLTGVHCLAQGPYGPWHVFAGCYRRLYEWLDHPGVDTGWRNVDTRLPDIWRIGVFPAYQGGTVLNPGKVVLATYDGIWWAPQPANPGDNYEWVAYRLAGAGSLNQGKYDLALGPNNTIIVMAAANTGNPGLYIGSWSDPSNPGELVLKPISGLPATGTSFVAIASCDSDRRNVYALAAKDDGTFGAIWKSQDGGGSWNVVPSPTIDGTPLDQRLDQGEGNFWTAVTCLAVCPSNHNELSIGWRDLPYDGPYMSSDGGRTWIAPLPSAALHADVNALHYDPNLSGRRRLFVGSDGGVAFSEDSDGGISFLGEQWSGDYNVCLANLQFYSTYPTRNFYGTMAANEQWMVGGLQDNGNVFVAQGDTGPWSGTGPCGDGGSAYLLATGQLMQTCTNTGDQDAPTTALFGSLPSGTFEPIPIRNENGSIDGRGLLGPVLEVVNNARYKNAAGQLMYAVGWSNYVLQGPNGPVRLTVRGGYGLFGNQNGGDLHWENLGYSPWSDLVDHLEHYDVSALGSSDGGVIYFATNGGKVFRMAQPDPQSRWIIEELPVSVANDDHESVNMSRIYVASDAKFYALLNKGKEGFVLRYTAHFPSGVIWDTVLGPDNGLSGGLYYALVGDASDNVVLVADDNHVYATSDGGETWQVSSDGLPADAHCADLRYSKLSGGRRAFFLSTYGRSMWMAEV